MIRDLARKGFAVNHLVTACGTCRDSLERLDLPKQFPELVQTDVTQLVLPRLAAKGAQNTIVVKPEGDILCHGACHCEWAGVHRVKGQQQMAAALGEFAGCHITLQTGCCGESGTGAVTSPAIFNVLRARKQGALQNVFDAGYGNKPILVGCPSCKIGIGRCCINLKHGKQPVLHTTEWLAGLLDGEDRRQSFCKKINETRGDVRIIC